MTPEQLELWFDDHWKNDVNYTYSASTIGQITEKALKSFERLTKDQQDRANKVFAKYGVSFELALRCRYMAQTNLFALCKLLGYSDMSRAEYIWKDETIHNTHEEICNAFFVRKDPTLASFKAQASPENYIGKKERLLLVPRGGFKSTMNMADCVQWIICFPEVTIMVLTGVFNLAAKFVGEIKGHFELDDKAEKITTGDFHHKKPLKPRTMKDGSLNMFQVLFPEHCISHEEGKATEYQTPAVSMPEKEPTVFASSIEQSLVGLHVCVLKLDDVVTNENSQTVERLKAVNKQVSINQAMLHPYGFYDIIGTWYDSADVYGKIIKDRDAYLASGDDFPFEVYIRPCWWLTKAAEAKGVIESKAEKQDYHLWFHEGINSLSFEKLKHKKRTDPYFAIKYLNDPTQMHAIKFPRELLIQRTCPTSELPERGFIVTVVDTAYSTKSWADYTVIITALIYGGRFYILDMKRGRYNEYDLPQLIAAAALQWKPKAVCIEDSVGVKWLGREVNREMARLKFVTPLRFVSLGLGSKATSKVQKAKPVLRFIGDDRLRFVNMCPGLEEIYDELSKFGTAESTHDDIVSALSILVMEYASYADMDAKMSVNSSEYVADPKAKQFYDAAYGLGKYAKYNQLAQDNPDMTPQEIVKAVQQDAIDFANNDPLADLWSQ